MISNNERKGSLEGFNRQKELVKEHNNGEEPEFQEFHISNKKEDSDEEKHQKKDINKPIQSDSIK